MNKFQVALNGLTHNSVSADHVWCVFAAWGETYYRVDLTYSEAQALAERLNSRWSERARQRSAFNVCQA